MSDQSQYDISKTFAGQPRVVAAYEHLGELVGQHLPAGTAILTSSGGAQMLIDTVFYGLVNRSWNVSEAILVLVARRNFVAAAPLVRVQMDTLLRLCYIRTLRNSDAFAKLVLSGAPIHKSKDAEGQFLTDSRLRYYARRMYPWIDKAYEELSRLVHFSNAHIYSSMSSVSAEGRGRIYIGVGQSDELWPPSEVTNLLELTTEVTNGILAHLFGWAKWKNENFRVVE